MIGPVLLHAPETRTCATCRQRLPLARFFRDTRRNSRAYRGSCKTCLRQQRIANERGEIERALATMLGPSGMCICGALAGAHRGGKGSCAATGCDYFYEKGT